MSGRTLRFVERATQADPGDPSVDVVVLDTWWTPKDGDALAAAPLRPVVDRVLATADLVSGSLDRLDAWAEAAGLADLFVAGGVTWWFRIRMAVRWDVHELMLWQRILSEVAPDGRYDTIEVPWRRTALAAAARAFAARRPGDPGAPSERPRIVLTDALHDRPSHRLRRAAAGLRRWAARMGPVRSTIRTVRGLSPAVRVRRSRLRARVTGLSADRPRVLAVAWAGAFHTVRERGHDRRMDPHLSLVLDRLTADGSRVAMVVDGLDDRRAVDWSTIAADERIVPQRTVDELGREAPGGDRTPRGRARPASIRPVALDVDGTDLGPALARIVANYAGRWLDDQLRATDRAERFLADVRPGVLYLDREGTRTRWIVAARRQGIPVVAVQHGMIYPGNPEYCHPAHPAAPRPDLTCVFGRTERDLLVEQAGFAAGAVAVTGSPRADPATIDPATPDERAAVRAELGVAETDRLLVVSVAHNQVMGDLYSAAMVGRVLGGPLPGIHVVVKLHPQDRDEPDYPGLLAGLARAGGYRPPPVRVVRDIDLYRLLRAADAHLGQYSTVLTDAVVVGIPNMIAFGQAHADQLGHVAAGVAVPVRSVDDVRAFMLDPRPPSEADRARFLEQHFEPGDAVGRIGDLLLARAR